MASAEILDRLAAVIAERAEARPTGSYVVQLLDGGVPSIAAKIREEAEELIEAAGEADRQHTAHEAADLLFHVWVLLRDAGVEADAVFGELTRRFGTGGLAEKAARQDAVREKQGDREC